VDSSAHLPPPAAAPANQIELRLESNPARVAEARRAVERFAAGFGFPDALQADIGLCVNEALANVIRHAYGGKPGRPILIGAEFDSHNVQTPVLRITIRDWGNGENPACMPSQPRDPLVPGGVGMICLRSLMDEITFTPQPDGMLLTMVKKKPQGAP
jgi:serine/threonine-protein kinase RsbW